MINIQPKNINYLAELFEFDYQGIIYYYTNYPYAITDNETGSVYTPIYLQRSGELKLNLSLEEKELVLLSQPLDIFKEVATIKDEMMVRFYFIFLPEITPPEAFMKLNVNQSVYNNSSFLGKQLRFFGYYDISHGIGTDGLLEVHFKDYVGTRLSRNLLTMSIQNFCNNILFDENCGLVEAAYEEAATLTEVTGNLLRSPTFAGHPDGYWYLGKLTLVKSGATQIRLITAHTGDQIELQYPFLGIGAEVGDSITIRPGCDKKAETCLNRFSNILNFTGFPYLVEEGS